MKIATNFTAEKLTEMELFWKPELLFVEDKGYKLILDIDAFNGHMNWDVKWFDKYDGLEHCVEFTDFTEARDYFLEKTTVKFVNL